METDDKFPQFANCQVSLRHGSMFLSETLIGLSGDCFIGELLSDEYVRVIICHIDTIFGGGLSRWLECFIFEFDAEKRSFYVKLKPQYHDLMVFCPIYVYPVHSMPLFYSQFFVLFMMQCYWKISTPDSQFGVTLLNIQSSKIACERFLQYAVFLISSSKFSKLCYSFRIFPGYRHNLIYLCHSVVLLDFLSDGRVVECVEKKDCNCPSINYQFIYHPFSLEDDNSTNK